MSVIVTEYGLPADVEFLLTEFKARRFCPQRFGCCVDCLNPGTADNPLIARQDGGNDWYLICQDCEDAENEVDLEAES